MEPLSDTKLPVCPEKLSKPKVSENIKKIKERIIQTNQLLQLFKTKEKELAQHKECIASLEQKLSKMRTQTITLNKENEVFRQAAQQFRSEVEKINKELGQKDAQLKDHITLTNELKRLRAENEKLGKKNKSLEVLKSQLECKVQENEATVDIRENQAKEITRLKKELEKKEEQCKKSQLEKASVDSKMKKLQRDVEKSKEALNNRINMLEASSLEKDTTIESLSHQLEESRQQENNVEDMRHEIIRLTNIEQSQVSNSRELDELKKQMQQAKAVNIKIKKEYVEQSREMNKLKKRNAELEKFKRETQDVRGIVQNEKDALVSNLPQGDKETIQHVILLIEEIQFMKHDVENLEIQKKALQDLVTAQQLEISRLKKFRKSVSFSRVNEIEKLYNKLSEIPSQERHSNMSPDRDSSIQCLATSPLELVDSNSRDSQTVSQNETRKPGINVQPSSSSISEKDMAGERNKLNKLKRHKLMDVCAEPRIVKKVITASEDTTNEAKKGSGRKRKESEATLLLAPNILSKDPEQPKKRRISKKTEITLKNKVFFDPIDDLTFIKEKIQDFTSSSQESFRSMDVLRQFAFDKSAVFLQALDELIRSIDTPLYLDSDSRDDALRNFTRKGSFLIQIPTVLPQKETNILLFLWFLFSEFPTSRLLDKIIPWINDKFILCGNNFDDLVDLTYCCRWCRVFVALCRAVKDLQRIRVLCYDILREKTDRRCIQHLIENIARICPMALKASEKDYNADKFSIDESLVLRTVESIVAGVFIEKMHDESVYKMYKTFVHCCSWNEPSRTPLLEKILKSLVDVLQSEEFHNRCFNEYHQEQFQEYCFNLIKCFELATCWLKWDDVFDRFIGKILWPLVKDEKGKDIPLEIIGAICRPRLSEHEDKIGVDEIRRRVSLSLNQNCPVSFTLQVQSAQVLIKLSNGNASYFQDILSWFSHLQDDKIRQLPKSLIDDLEYIRSLS
ncbi:13686_t:CDS:10 [Acaulospora morrowiae]|uniref:13686_t:CDS:1 n=1 Tax=Acaulospora morrowiae TaxID=94023 RepID=A0A9N9FEJ6_9GLOM|nr:13686_t:CDS:10 [Acaulospora morrowiae]